MVGSTGYSFQVSQFDRFVNLNYDKLKRDAAKHCKHSSDYEDIFHKKLIAVRDRIQTAGSNHNDYRAIINLSIINEYKKDKRLEKDIVSIENFEFDADNNTEEERHLKNELKAEYVFEYVTNYYNQQLASLFEIYYMTKSNTYKKVVESTGYSFRYVKDCISKMKKDLRLNFDSYYRSKITGKQFTRIIRKNDQRASDSYFN